VTDREPYTCQQSRLLSEVVQLVMCTVILLAYLRDEEIMYCSYWVLKQTTRGVDLAWQFWCVWRGYAGSKPVRVHMCTNALLDPFVN